MRCPAVERVVPGGGGGIIVRSSKGSCSKFRTGVPWRDLPERFGPWQTVHGRFARWAADGTFDRLLAAAQGRGEADWLVALDSTIVRAHQHTAAKEGSRSVGSDAPAVG
jgi:transposase